MADFTAIDLARDYARRADEAIRPQVESLGTNPEQRAILALAMSIRCLTEAIERLDDA